MTTTKHAELRLRQRAIPAIILEWLDEFGAHTKQNGSELVFFDQESRRRLQRYLGRLYARVEEFLDAYAILSQDGDVITVGHRYKRMNYSR